MFFEVPPYSGDSTSGADPADESGDPAFGLLPDLRTSDSVVILRVVWIRELVGLPGVWDFASKTGSDTATGLGGVALRGGRRHHHLGPIRFEKPSSLATHPVRHYEDTAIALDSRDHRKADGGISGHVLYDGPARPQQSVTLCSFHHGKGDAVLDAATGIHELDLRVDGCCGLPYDPTNPDQGSLADRLQHVAAMSAHGCCLQSNMAPTSAPV